jgi:hypothetical protein
MATLSHGTARIRLKKPALPRTRVVNRRGPRSAKEELLSIRHYAVEIIASVTNHRE